MSRDLHGAITGGSNYMVRRALQQGGVNVNARNANGRTPFQRALELRHYDIARTLVRAGANVNGLTSYGGTILRAAVGAGNIRMIRFLIESGANLNRRDEHGHTALWLATGRGQVDIVRLLLKAGAQVNRNTLNAARNNQVRNLIINEMGQVRMAKKVIRRAETALRNRRKNSILRHTLGRTNLPGTALNIISRSVTARRIPSSVPRNQGR